MSAECRVQLERAFILHRRPYRETSLLLEALTPGWGRIGLVARGVRRPRSRLAGLLQPFRPLLLSWIRRGELGTLTGADLATVPPAVGGAALLSGFYVNELLLRLLPRDDPHPELFDAYAGTLAGLREETGTERALRIFEKHLLGSIGYGLVLEHDAESGQAIEPQRTYAYYPERGPIALAAVGPRTGAVQVSGHTLLALASEELDDPQGLREAKRLMRHVLRAFLGDKPLASRSLFHNA